MRRFLPALAGLIATALLLAAGPSGEPGRTWAGAESASPAAPACARGILDDDDWGTVAVGNAGQTDPADPLAAEVDELIDLWVDRHTGRRLVVTDGRIIELSLDAGCSWDTTFSLDDADAAGPAQGVGAHIVAIDGADVPGTPLVAVVAEVDEASLVARLRTQVSADGGRTWAAGGDGLPDVQVGSTADRCEPNDGLCVLRVAPSDPQVVYLLIDEVGGPALYGSQDGGRTFSLRSDATAGLTLGETATAPMLVDVAVDLDDPALLWGAVREGPVVVSTDGGRTWARFDVDLDMNARILAAPFGTDTAIAVLTWDASVPPRLVASTDTGRTWHRAPVGVDGGAVTGLALGDDVRQIHWVDGLGAHALNLITLEVESRDGSQFAPLRGPTQLHGQDLTWYLGQGTLAVYGDVAFIPPLGSVASHLGDLDPFDPAVPRGRLPGQLIADADVVTLAPGETVDVAMTLRVPPEPTPVDVFFLFDESNTMRDEIDALKRGAHEIVNALRLRKLDVQVGVGGYAGSYRYRRYRAIGPADAEFQDALSIIGSSSSDDEGEYAYTALHQVATGTGLARHPDSSQLPPQPGWDAAWREGTVRIVVHLGDEELQELAGDPTRDEAIAALREERILHLGLVSTAEPLVHDRLSGEEPWRDLARETGAFAGPSGIDCDGDGLTSGPTDVSPGEPILCFIPTVARTDDVAAAVDAVPDMADVIVEVLAGVSEEHEITFHTDRSDLVTALVPLGSTRVDIRRAVAVDITARVACPVELAGTVEPAAVTAVAGARHLAATSLQVACGVVPAAVVAASGPPPGAVAGSAPVLAPPATQPIAPPPGGQGLPASTTPASSAAQAPATSAQGAVAGARQQQPQVQSALAGGADQREAAPDDAALFLASSRGRGDVPAGLVTTAGGVMASAAGALMLRRRRLGAAVPSYVTRGRGPVRGPR